MAKGASAIRAADHDAVRELARQRRGRDDPLPLEPRGPDAIKAGQWAPHFKTGLPSNEGCEFPITCLGHAGGLYHLIDSAGEFRSEPASFFSHAGLQDVFAAVPNYPQWCCPRYARTKEGEPPRIDSFKDDAIRTLIFRACTRAGLFAPTDRLRGRGAWKLRGGQLIYHAGEEVWIAEGGRITAQPTGLIERHLYPRMPELPAPWTEPMTAADNPGRALIETFRQWEWERPEVDPVLLLGWIGVAYLGGALDWRSALFLLGGFGTGKSTLQEGLKDLFGDALFQSADTTAAGIYQKVGHDARPVALDELEADADTRKVQAVVRLARAASSGAIGSRGGADGSGTEFQMRSAFLFSAINNPLQSAQDLSRVAILRLRTLKDGAKKPPPIDADTCGRRILGRLMTEWPRWDATLAAAKKALADGGHNARGQATYGALLAAADMILGNEVATDLGIDLPSEHPGFWATALAAEALPEIESAIANWRGCIKYLLGSQVEVWRAGERTTVGKLLEDLIVNHSIELGPAQRQLELTGLGLCVPGEKGLVGDGHLLAVPNSSQLVAKLFAGSQWAGISGANGPWMEALRQGAEFGIVVTDRKVNRVTINGQQERCTLIVLKRYHEASET